MVEEGEDDEYDAVEVDSEALLPQMVEHHNQRGGLNLNADSQEVCYISQSSHDDTSYLLGHQPQQKMMIGGAYEDDDHFY